MFTFVKGLILKNDLAIWSHCWRIQTHNLPQSFDCKAITLTRDHHHDQINMFPFKINFKDWIIELIKRQKYLCCITCFTDLKYGFVNNHNIVLPNLKERYQICSCQQKKWNRVDFSLVVYRFNLAEMFWYNVMASALRKVVTSGI